MYSYMYIVVEMYNVHVHAHTATCTFIYMHMPSPMYIHVHAKPVGLVHSATMVYMRTRSRSLLAQVINHYLDLRLYRDGVRLCRVM